ncbi:MAG TPA: hypothetical protein VMZ05_03045 [Spirochaetota bacterium]|nr:hypothetical protein [Spirochaetota bacterium]
MRCSLRRRGSIGLLSAAVTLLVCTVLPGLSQAQTEYIGRAEIRHLRWGESRDGWKKIYFFKNLRIEEGPLGTAPIVIGDNSPTPDGKTDLLLSFDGLKDDYVDLGSSNYTAQEVQIVSSPDIKMFGDGAAGFFHHNNLLALKPLKGSVLLEDPLGSFTVDFYLFPNSVREENRVFSWYAPAVDSAGYSGVRAYFRDGRLFWEFQKVFSRQGSGARSGVASSAAVDVVARELHKTPIGEWHHHAIHYNAETGLLTLLFDGEESALVWLTEDGTEEGSVLYGRFSPYLKAPLIIGEQYLGFIDEFRISRGLPLFYLGRYRERGEMRSEVISLPSRGTKLVNVTWESEEKSGTAVRVYCRFSDSYFLPGEAAQGPADPALGDEANDRESPGWIRVRNGEPADKTLAKGKYMQWKAELLGTENRYTPRLTSLDFALELDPPPEPPTLIEAAPADRGVRLRWVKNNESDIKGYMVYYGTSSRFYFGKGSNEGDSPVGVGNVSSFMLSGLGNEQVYFFSITAVDDEGQESGFSREFIGRPSGIYKE